jgi:flavin-dependent dehydrogenase
MAGTVVCGAYQVSLERKALGVGSDRRKDALVIGGGLAGSALAVWLARAGRSVVLLEKTAGAHPKVCGEFLSHEALHYLARLGVDPVRMGAVPIEQVRLVNRRGRATTRLPFAALSLSRECLDQALLEEAEASGVDVLRGRRARSLTASHAPDAEAIDPCWSAETEQDEEFTGRQAFLATGKHDLYGWNRPVGKQKDLIAFKMHWRLGAAEHAALERHVELVLFPGGYAGLQPVESGGANLCLLVRRGVYRELGGSWAALLEHMCEYSDHLAGRLEDATPSWTRPLSLSAIPYGYVRAESEAAGLWRLGDQSAVIPSFAGEGMSIALHSAALAAKVFCAGGGALEFQRRLQSEVAGQVGLATWISRLMVSAPGMVAGAARLWPGVLARLGESTRIRGRHLLG